METSNFIDHLSAGNASEAKSVLTDMLSARAFEALDAKKIELAKTIFTGKEESVEVQDTEETETEQ
jgi:hypothetical protein